jgi:uncharacterized damage-inducible protein DinB
VKKRSRVKKRSTVKKRNRVKKRTRGASPKKARKRAAPVRKRAKKAARRAPSVAKRSKSVRGAKKKPVRRTPAARTRTRLKLVKPPVQREKRPARRVKPAPAPPAFQQTSGASPKQLLLFELMRARTAVLAAIQGLTPGSAEKPIGKGNWSVREIVLHLVTCDRIRLREMEAVLRGVKASWADISADEQNALNERDLAELRHLSWDEALRLLHTTRQELIEDLESLPEDPVEVWSRPHPFGWMMQRLPAHDRHHADAIKAWRDMAGA